MPNKLGCGAQWMKYLLFAFNLLFFLLGLVAISVGSWAIADKNKMLTLAKAGVDNTDIDMNVTGMLENSAILFLVGGAVAFIIGFLGCCGAIKENKFLLCLYGVLLIVIFGIEIAAIAIAGVYRGRVTADLKKYLKTAIIQRYEGTLDTTEAFSLAVDFTQVYFECCGVTNYTDFEDAEKWNRTVSSAPPVTLAIPPSCCRIQYREKYIRDHDIDDFVLVNSTCPETMAESHIDTSCWDSILSWMMERIGVVLGITISTLIVEMGCIVFAFRILQAIRNKEKEDQL